MVVQNAVGVSPSGKAPGFDPGTRKFESPMGHHLKDYSVKVELIDGEVSEWFKELVLKTSDSERGRGFESHPLRHIV